VMWPRGELGSLPADAAQFQRIEYLERTVDEIRAQLGQP
jgi:hypothetical protein